MFWLISANSKMYNHSEAFSKFRYIDWRRNANYNIGDYVYIYSTKPMSKIKYKCLVEKIDMKFSEITNDKEFWNDKKEYEKSIKKRYFRLRLIEENQSDSLKLKNLMENGLKAAPQGPTKVNDTLLSYIEEYFNNNENDTIVSEELSDNEELLEGLGVKITVNRYERNNVARRKCIEYMGSTCVICGFNFSDFYGDFAKDYIHVHHVVPLSRIKSEYLIDYKKDLVPVCPNCHAMIHFKKDSSYLTIDELRIIIKKKNLDTHK